MSDADIAAAAQRLGADANALKAILRVESAGPGFSAGKILIAFEPFHFSELTGHRFDASHPAISNSNRAPVGGNQAARWEKLAEVYALDPDAALGATSWGAFQLPGRYFATAGYSNVFAFVDDMAKSEARQLAAFEAYVSRAGLADELQRRDWSAFAGAYEGGPGAAAYADALSRAYAALPPPADSGYLTSLRVADTAPLTRADFEAVAARLGCEWEAAAAVAEVESGPLGGFANDGRPIILFERHLFSRKTNSRFDASHPNISNRTPGGYPRTQAERWDQLMLAYSLDPEAALQSASYGRFQVLGQNYPNLGMANAHDYVAKLARSQKDQLEAFEGFVRANGLSDELQRLDWAGFASRYNGPGYAANQYDTKMAQAYARLKSTPIA
ncbi:MAG: N-acetylmuramidase domain-containing protein [Caulobacteraceae bacterium]